MLSSELKPCPFCGGEAETICIDSESAYQDFHTVVCRCCGCETGVFGEEEASIKAWNTRAMPIPDTPEMVRALNDAYEAGRKSMERTCRMIPNGETDFAATLTCSVCGNVESVYAISSDEFNYCPNCGAKVVE